MDQIGHVRLGRARASIIVRTGGQGRHEQDAENVPHTQYLRPVPSATSYACKLGLHFECIQVHE